MPTKISEKKLTIGVVCFVAGIFLFIKTPLVSKPVHVSEKGALLCAVAISLLVLAMRFFKQAVVKI